MHELGKKAMEQFNCFISLLTDDKRLTLNVGILSTFSISNEDSKIFPIWFTHTFFPLGRVMGVWQIHIFTGIYNPRSRFRSWVKDVTCKTQKGRVIVYQRCKLMIFFPTYSFHSCHHAFDSDLQGWIVLLFWSYYCCCWRIIRPIYVRADINGWDFSPSRFSFRNPWQHRTCNNTKTKKQNK